MALTNLFISIEFHRISKMSNTLNNRTKLLYEIQYLQYVTLLKTKQTADFMERVLHDIDLENVKIDFTTLSWLHLLADKIFCDDLLKWISIRYRRRKRNMAIAYIYIIFTTKLPMKINDLVYFMTMHYHQLWPTCSVSLLQFRKTDLFMHWFSIRILSSVQSILTFAFYLFFNNMRFQKILDTLRQNKSTSYHRHMCAFKKTFDNFKESY